ncbi:MAG: histidine phosphatase family protein, partial [Pseudomonadota bacterium]
GGESYAEAADRTRDFLLSLKGPALIAGHGASGRLLRGYLRGMKRNAVPHMRAPQDVAHKIERGREMTI